MPLGRRVFAVCLWTLRTIPRTEKKTDRRKREEEETLHYELDCARKHMSVRAHKISGLYTSQQFSFKKSSKKEIT